MVRKQNTVSPAPTVERREGTFVPSRYNTVSREACGHRLLYNSLTQNLIKLSAGEYESMLSDESPDPELPRLGFLVDTRMDELDAALRMNELQRVEPSHGLSVTIVPSLACDFSCGYCYNGINHDAGNPETGIDEAIAYCEEELKAGEPLTITWYGGEPLLFFKAILNGSRRLQNLAESRNASYKADLLTNGSLLTPKVATALPDLGIKTMQVSIDWPLSESQRHRPRETCEAALIRTLENINNVPRSVDLTLRVNCMPGFLDSFEGLLSRIDEHIHRPIQIGVATLFISNDASLNTVDSKRFRYDQRRVEFYQDEQKAKALLRQAGFPQSFYPESGAGSPCTAERPGRNRLYTADGSVRTCPREVNGSGAMIEKEEPNRLALEYRNRRTNVESGPCGTCAFLPICHGGCVKDQVEEPSELHCTPWKFTLENELTDYLIELQ